MLPYTFALPLNFPIVLCTSRYIRLNDFLSIEIFELRKRERPARERVGTCKISSRSRETVASLTLELFLPVYIIDYCRSVFITSSLLDSDYAGLTSDVKAFNREQSSQLPYCLMFDPTHSAA